MTALRLVIARTAAVIRCAGIAYVAVQVVIWHSFYAADRWRLAGPIAAVAWAFAAVAYLRRRWPPWQLAGLDAGVYMALALGAGWCVPSAIRGDPASWLFIVVASQLIVPAWFAPAAVSAPLAVGSAAAYWAGVTVTSAASSAGTRLAAVGALVLVAVAAAHRYARRMLYRRATGADVALAQADRDSAEQYVVLSRNIERREHERLLHDTVLNTLTALARAGGGNTRGVVGRCRHDVALMEYVLGNPGAPDGQAARLYGGLLAAIEAVAAEMRARGMDVHVNVVDRVPAGAGLGGDAAVPAGAAAVPAVPVPVAVAMARAVREALANVAAHAGTGEAWVEVCPAAPGGDVTAPGGDVTAPDGLQVTVRDAGAGFDPARVDPARLGLRRSIIERIADRDGRASITSAPGEGTLVSLCWPAPAQTSSAQNSPAQPSLDGAAGRAAGRVSPPC